MMLEIGSTYHTRCGGLAVVRGKEGLSEHPFNVLHDNGYLLWHREDGVVGAGTMDVCSDALELGKTYDLVRKVEA